MYIVNIARETLVQLLPKQSVGLEIGVALGDFSETLLRVVQPRKLHLVDPWTYQTRADYRVDPNNVPTDEGDRRHASVLARFASQINAGQVDVLREFSKNATATFSPRYFDWIYIDSIHTYDGVRDDLENYYPLVRDGGFILGHDFTNRSGAREWNFAVVEAVTDFLKLHDCELIAVTQEICPTYLIMKRHYHDIATFNTICSAFTENGVVCFEVPNHLLNSLKHHHVGEGGTMKCWFSI